MSSPSTATPAMRQYLDAKRQHRDAIVFFRMGDFYEMFYEDALVAARALDLTLTSRSKDAGGAGIPMCGVPFHAMDGYLAKLVKKGFRVAICEQVEDPKKAKGLVKREVVRVVSPGHAHRRELSGCARTRVPDGDRRHEPADHGNYATVSASRCSISPRANSRPPNITAPTDSQALADEIAVAPPARDRRPRRVSRAGLALPVDTLPEIARLQIPVTTTDAWSFEPEAARRSLLDQLKTHGLDGFGLDGRVSAIQAAGGLIAYLRDTQKADLAHVRAISLQGRRRLPAHRSDHAQASRGRRRQRRRTAGFAAQRDRSHRHVDGRTDAPRVAAAPAASRSSGSAIGWTPSRSSPFAPRTAASSARC